MTPLHSGQGLLIEKILQEKLRTCSLDDIRNKADVLVYWGSDAQDSQPRHLSRSHIFHAVSHASADTRKTDWQ